MDALAHLKASLASRYVIEREIGRGGMATVYLARDIRHNRNVALKVLNPELRAVLGGDRFLSEIQVTANLSHPNLLPLFDSGEVDGVLFYVMPYVQGESLRERLRREKQLPIDEAVELGVSIANALHYAHRQGVIHRDLKPENILLHEGQPLLADFGIALAVSAAGGERITQTGVSLGTPQYMSPEQATGDRSIDQRSDIYSLAALLYECLTGDPPHTASTAQAVIARVMTDDPRSIRATRPDVPPKLEAAVRRALAKLPADRWKTAQEFADALRGTGSDAAPASRGTMTMRSPWVLAAGVAVLALGAGALFVTQDRDATNLEQAGSATAASTRLAVLPMANLGADTSDAYFAAGMTDELISTLSDIAGVQVMARGAVIPYAGSTKPLSEIGRELGVGTLLESTCRKERNRLRISVRLVDARTQEQRWSQQYDRELTDAFSIQRDVARSVAAALRVRLSGPESQALNRSGLPTTSAEAYEAYLRGRIAMPDPVTRARNEEAISSLQKAVALDSGFAVAQAMLGKAYVTRLFRFEPGPRYRNLAAAAIDRALALDSTLAEAYLARAELAYSPEAGWRYDDALRDFLHALSLKPGLSQAHAALGSLLFHIGMPREALVRLRHAISLDPSDGFSPPRIGRTLWQSQQFDSALVAYERAPNVFEHALVMGHLGREREGLAYLERADTLREADLTGDFASVRAVLYARLGDRSRAMREILTVERSRAVGTAHFHHAQFNVATALAVLGRRDDAVRWLEQTAANGMPAYELFVNDPHLASLKGHAGYERLLQRERPRYEARKAVYSRSSLAR